MSETAKRFGLTPLYDASHALATREYTGSFAKEFLIYTLPLASALAGLAIGWARPSHVGLLHLICYALIGFGIGRLIKTAFVYPPLESPTHNQVGLAGDARTIESLVTHEINASHINGVPCTIEGKIIGRGVPGLFWSKDLVLRDDSGLIQIIYRQPFSILELWFGVAKAEYVVGHPARVHGWYRRAPVPYVEISSVELKDSMQTMRCYYKWGSYATALFSVALGAALALWW